MTSLTSSLSGTRDVPASPAGAAVDGFALGLPPRPALLSPRACGPSP